MWLIVPCYKVRGKVLDVIAKAPAWVGGHRLRRRRLTCTHRRLHRSQRNRSPGHRGAACRERGRRRRHNGRLSRSHRPRRRGVGQGRRRRPDGPPQHQPPGRPDPAGGGRLRQGQPLHLDQPPGADAGGPRVRKRGAELRGQAFHRLLERLRPDQRLHRHRGAGGEASDAEAGVAAVLLRDRSALSPGHFARGGARRADAGPLRRRGLEPADRRDRPGPFALKHVLATSSSGCWASISCATSRPPPASS